MHNVIIFFKGLGWGILGTLSVSGIAQVDPFMALGILCAIITIQYIQKEAK